MMRTEEKQAAAKQTIKHRRCGLYAMRVRMETVRRTVSRKTAHPWNVPFENSDYVEE
jgi:hypothetical protein